MQILNIPQLGLDEERMSYLFAALVQHIEGQQLPFNPTVFVEGIELTPLESFTLGALLTSSIYELTHQINQSK